MYYCALFKIPQHMFWLFLIWWKFSAECASKLGESTRGVEWARAGVQAGGGERAGALLASLLLNDRQIQAALNAYDHALALVYLYIPNVLSFQPH